MFNSSKSNIDRGVRCQVSGVRLLVTAFWSLVAGLWTNEFIHELEVKL
jgi:hypothetical protein